MARIVEKNAMPSSSSADVRAGERADPQQRRVDDRARVGEAAVRRSRASRNARRGERGRARAGSSSPTSPPSRMASESSPRPTMTSVGAEQVGQPGRRARRAARRTRRGRRGRSRAPSGRLTTNTQRQSSSTSAPPSGGPEAAASAADAPHSATADARCATGYIGRISASETAMITAAPGALQRAGGDQHLPARARRRTAPRRR